MREHRVETFDGVSLAWYEAGDGPTVALANGIGVDRRGLMPQVLHLARRFRVVLWDYRGVGGSGPLPSGRSLSMARHARDLAVVLDAAGAERAALVGWSMGVDVVLELMRVRPDRVWSLVLCCGGSSRLAEQLVGVPGVGPAARALLRVAARAHVPIERAVRLGAGSSLIAPLAVRAGLLGRDADRRVFADQARSVAACDMRTYLGTMAELLRAECDDVLPLLSVPTLVVAGERDRLVRLATARELAARIPGARLFVVPGASHFCVLERPRLVNLEVERHLLRSLEGA